MDKSKFVKQLFAGKAQSLPAGLERRTVPADTAGPLVVREVPAQPVFQGLEASLKGFLEEAPAAGKASTPKQEALRRIDTNDMKRLLSQLDYGLPSQTPIASQVKPVNLFAKKKEDGEALNDADQLEIEEMLKNDANRYEYNGSSSFQRPGIPSFHWAPQYNHSDHSNANLGPPPGFHFDQPFPAFRPGCPESDPQGFGGGFPVASAGIFQTFKGGAIQLSKEQLAQAAKLIGDTGDEEEPEASRRDGPEVAGNQSQKTASFSTPFQNAQNGFGPPAALQDPGFQDGSFASFTRNGATRTATDFQAAPPMSSSGAISFSTGGFKQIAITEEAMKKALALLGDPEEEPANPSPAELPAKRQPGADKPSGKATPEEKPEEPADAQSSKEAPGRDPAEKKPAEKPSAFIKEPERLPKKAGPKRAFGVPYKRGPLLGQKLGAAPGVERNPVRAKLRESKLSNKVFLDQDRYKKMSIGLNKRKKLGNNISNKLAGRNYGVRFLTVPEVFEHIRPELQALSIQTNQELLDELTLELQIQANSTEVCGDWVKHHLQMLGRKYHDRVRIEGPCGLNYPFTAAPCVIPYPVSLSNILTDLYYRYKREDYFESKSYLRRVIESSTAFSNMRLCLLVSSVLKEGSLYTIELTDGWYVVYTSIHCGADQEQFLLTNRDSFLDFEKYLVLRLVLNGKIKVGDKLDVANLEVEKPDSKNNKSGDKDKPVERKEGNYRVEVKLHYNSIKKLPIQCKLGMLYSKLKPTKLNTIKARGGMVPMIDVIVLEKKGIRIVKENGADEFMIKMRESDTQGLELGFGITVLDSLHLDPQYDKPQTYHLFTFSAAAPNTFQSIEVGQRLRIYGVKIKKKVLDKVVQANYNINYSRGLTFYVSKKQENNVQPLVIPAANRERLPAMLGPWKRFNSIELIKDRLLETEKNLALGVPNTEGVITSLALRYIKHSEKYCLFHFYEKHFIQVELLYDQISTKGKDAPSEGFWQRTVKDLSSLTESSAELLILYDIMLKPNPKVINLITRGSITLHKFVFDPHNNFIVGENFVVSNCSPNSLERFLIADYKAKYKTVKLSEDDTMAKLIQDMSKIQLHDS